MSCYICGNAAVKRLTPDLDSRGIELCDDKNCHQLLMLVLYTDNHSASIENRLSRIRRKKHRERGNPLPNA